MKKVKLDEITVGKIKDVVSFYAKQDEAFSLIESCLVYDNDLCCLVIKGEYLNFKLDDFLKLQKKKFGNRTRLSLSILRRAINSGKIRLKKGKEINSLACKNKINFEYHGFFRE